MHVTFTIEVLYWCLFYRLYKLCSCFVSLLVYHGESNFLQALLSFSGWTVGTTSVTGQPPTRITQSAYLRSDFRHRMRPSGLNPGKLLSFPLCAVRSYRTMHRTSLIIMRGIRSTFENCHDSLTYSKSIFIRDEGPNHRFSKLKSNLSRGSEHHPAREEHCTLLFSLRSVLKLILWPLKA